MDLEKHEPQETRESQLARRKGTASFFVFFFSHFSGYFCFLNLNVALLNVCLRFRKQHYCHLVCPAG